MSKKHFISLADWIKRHNATHTEPFTLSQLATLAAFCESNNANFKRGRWLDYIFNRSGPNGGKAKPERVFHPDDDVTS